MPVEEMEKVMKKAIKTELVSLYECANAIVKGPDIWVPFAFGVSLFIMPSKGVSDDAP